MATNYVQIENDSEIKKRLEARSAGDGGGLNADRSVPFSASVTSRLVRKHPTTGLVIIQ